jgi:hypothetical protein
MSHHGRWGPGMAVRLGLSWQGRHRVGTSAVAVVEAAAGH